MASRQTINTLLTDHFKSDVKGWISAAKLRDFVLTISIVDKSRAPDSGDDDTDGYNIGTVWRDTSQTPNRIWVCVDNSSGDATWRHLLTSATGSFSFEDIIIEGHQIKATSSDGIQLLSSGGVSSITIDKGIILEASNGVSIIGNLYQSSGTSFITESEKVQIYDNLAMLNRGEVSPGIIEGFSGWEIDRGTYTPYRWGFDESADLFKLGEYYNTLEYVDSSGNFETHEKIIGSSSNAIGYIFSSTGSPLSLKGVNGSFVGGEAITGVDSSATATTSGTLSTISDLQAGATREDAPTEKGIPYWNNNQSLFVTSSELTRSSGVTFSDYTILGNDLDIDRDNVLYNLYIEGDTRLQSDGSSGKVETYNFVSGWNNKGGLRINSGQASPVSHSEMIVDELTVRNKMRIYELLINQIRATNGSLFVASAAKVEDTSGTVDNTTLIFEDVTEHGVVPYLSGDVVTGTLLDNFDSSGTYGNATYQEVGGVIDSIDGLQADITWETGYEPPTLDNVIGTTFARVGNISDTDRQGNIYLTSDDDYSPFIDIKDNVSTYAEWESSDTLKVRLGKMAGLSNDLVSDSNSGYGLYASRVYLGNTDDNNYIKMTADENNATLNLTYGGNSIFNFNSSAETATLSSWIASSAYFYSLDSGTPSASPSSGVVLDANFNGIKGYDGRGNAIFKLGQENIISGLSFDNSVMYKEEGGVNLVEFGNISSFSSSDTEVSFTNNDFESGSSEWTDGETTNKVVVYDDGDDAEVTYADQINPQSGTGLFRTYIADSIITGGSSKVPLTSVSGASLESSQISITGNDGYTSYIFYINHNMNIRGTPYNILDNTTYVVDEDIYEHSNLTIKIYDETDTLIKSKSIKPSWNSWKEDWISFVPNSGVSSLKIKIENELPYWNAWLGDKVAGSYFAFGSGMLFIDNIKLYKGEYKNQYSQNGINLYRNSENQFTITSDEFTYKGNMFQANYLNIASSANVNTMAIGKSDKEYDNSVLEIGEGNISVSNGFSLKTESFNSSMVQGYGFGINFNEEEDGYSLYTDNITCRQRFKVWELEKNKVKVVGGNFFISDAYRCKTLTSTDWASNGEMYLEPDGNKAGNTVNIEVDDIVVCKKVDTIVGGVVTSAERYNPTDINGDTVVDLWKIDLNWESGYEPATSAEFNSLIGCDFTRIGSISDSTRQNIIYLTSDDNDAPFISLEGGIASISDWRDSSGSTQMRIGNLNNISDPILGRTLSTYGVYANSIYLSNQSIENGIALETETPLFEMISGGNTIFKFDGSVPEAKLANWNIDNNLIYSIDSGSPLINPQGGVVLDNNFHGIKGYDSSGNSLFQLGNTNQIAGFTYIDDTIYTEDSSGIVAISNNNIWKNDYSTLPWSSGKAELLMYSTEGGIPAIWLRDKESNGHVGMYYTDNSNWGMLGKNTSGNELFHLGSRNHIANWNFDSSGLHKTVNSKTIGLRSNVNQAFYITDEYDQEIISVGDVPFPSVSNHIAFTDEDFGGNASDLAWNYDLPANWNTEVVDGYEGIAPKVFVQSYTSDGMSSGMISQQISLSNEITIDDTINTYFWIYGGEASGYQITNQTVDFVVKLSNDEGSQTESKENISIAFNQWKKVSLTFGANITPDTVKIEIHPELFEDQISGSVGIKGSCIIDEFRMYKSVRDVTINSNGLRIFSNDNEYVELTKDGISIYGDEIGANTLDVRDNLTVYGDFVVRGNFSKVSDDNSAADIIPAEDDTYVLGNSEHKWAEINAVDANIGGLYESGLKTEGISKYPKGTVVVWDEGELKPCESKYDDKVVGVTDGHKNVPLVSGSEHIRVTGGIISGEFICASNKKGCGMKAEKRKWFIFKRDLTGKIIGQALESGSGEDYLIKAMIWRQ